MPPRHLIALDDLDAATIEGLLERARQLAGLWQSRSMPTSLAGRRIALVVDDGGWRNTTAFDLGITAMGGAAIHAPVTLAGKESPEDLAAFLANWFDAVAIRTPDLPRLGALAAAAPIPVINARTRQNHPCETLGDLAWLAAAGRRLNGLRVVAIAPEANILRSWVEAAKVLPIAFTQVYPHSHASDATATADLAAIDGADVLITDCWPAGADAATLAPYRVDEAMLARLARGGAFIPCPPVTRGQEVSAAAMAHPACRMVEAKDWLLHAQNAVLEWALPALPDAG